MHRRTSTPRIPPLAGAVLLLTGIQICLAGQDPPRYSERVEVARILLDVHAYDLRGRPLVGLEPSNFEVKIDGKTARVESVEHVTGNPVVNPPATTTRRPVAAGGRLVVFLFQKSLERSRIPGLMTMLRELRERVETFGPEDRVAVLRFDWKLELLQDFTRNKALVLKAFEHDVLFGAAPDRGEEQEPSLRASMAREHESPSHAIEQVLLHVGEALAPLPGPKSIVLVGHGFGQLTSTGVLLDTDYQKAREALQRARTSVFCLDVTNADYHSLEDGLITVAEDTGGLYERTHVFSRLALGRVLAALEGQYVLFVEGSALTPGSHRLSVRLRGREGEVLAPSHYLSGDRPTSK